MDPHRAIALSDHHHGVYFRYEPGKTGVHVRHAQGEVYEHRHASLPQADGEKNTWLFLIGSFCSKFYMGQVPLWECRLLQRGVNIDGDQGSL